MTLAEGTIQARPPFDIDILDPRFYDDPWDAYRWLRTNAPLWWDAKNELWVISRHEDLSHISRNADIYSAAQGVRPKVAAPMSIISMDDPEHTRQRRLINKGFTPRRIAQLADHIRELSNQIIDEIAERGECDFVEDFAIHVPLIVIAELMGLDPDARQKLYRWSDDMMAGDGHIDPDDPVLIRATTAGAEFAGVCIDLIEKRRVDGSTDDLIGVLTHAFDEGALAQDGEGGFAGDKPESLSHDELLMFLIVLVVAGNETTRNALTGGLAAFSRFPDQHLRLIEDPALMTTAVDEIVRYVSPVMTFMRTVTTDHTYKGVDLKAGERVFLLYQSANRDESVFDAPDEFRVDRSPNPHLGFGIGTHYCLGANLARAEIEIVFTELFARLRDIRAVDPRNVERGDNTLVLALKHLPTVFTPERTA
jgi:cytochrome P450 family 142 subfamily A polypeptide 1